METQVHHERSQAHELLDLLPVEKINVVRSLLEVLTEPEPLALSLSRAPVDDAAITPETAAEIAQACASLARGEGIPYDAILREFGLN